MTEYEIIGKDVYGTQAVTKNNTLNCSNCRYKDYDCSSMDCKDYFYLKDEELEKINNEKIIEFLTVVIKLVHNGLQLGVRFLAYRMFKLPIS